MSIADIQMVEIRIVKIKFGLFSLFLTIRCNEQRFHLTVEAEELIISQFGCFCILHILFSNDPRLNILIRPFASPVIILVLHAAVDRLSGGLSIKAFFIPAYDNPSGIVRALEHKLIRQCVEINIFKFIPDAQCRNDVFIPYDLRHIFFYFILVDQS